MYVLLRFGVGGSVSIFVDRKPVLVGFSLAAICPIACCHLPNRSLPLAQMVFRSAHAHAQIPSHRSPSVERFRIHVEGMVHSPGWIHGFPEGGRRRGPWRGGRAKDFLAAATAEKHNPLRLDAARPGLCKSRNRAATYPSLRADSWKYCHPA